MTPFQTMLAQDAANVFADPTQFGETVAYTSLGGQAKAINAQVFREPLQKIEGLPNPPAGMGIRIFISRDPALGIPTVNTGGDSITLPKRVGESPIAMRVSEILTQDAGGWLLRLR